MEVTGKQQIMTRILALLREWGWDTGLQKLKALNKCTPAHAFAYSLRRPRSVTSMASRYVGGPALLCCVSAGGDAIDDGFDKYILFRTFD